MNSTLLQHWTMLHVQCNDLCHSFWIGRFAVAKAGYCSAGLSSATPFPPKIVCTHLCPLSVFILGLPLDVSCAGAVPIWQRSPRHCRSSWPATAAKTISTTATADHDAQPRRMHLPRPHSPTTLPWRVHVRSSLLLSRGGRTCRPMGANAPTCFSSQLVLEPEYRELPPLNPWYFLHFLVFSG